MPRRKQNDPQQGLGRVEERQFGPRTHCDENCGAAQDVLSDSETEETVDLPNPPKQPRTSTKFYRRTGTAHLHAQVQPGCHWPLGTVPLQLTGQATQQALQSHAAITIRFEEMIEEGVGVASVELVTTCGTLEGRLTFPDYSVCATFINKIGSEDVLARIHFPDEQPQPPQPASVKPRLSPGSQQAVELEAGGRAAAPLPSMHSVASHLEFSPSHLVASPGAQPGTRANSPTAILPGTTPAGGHSMGSVPGAESIVHCVLQLWISEQGFSALEADYAEEVPRGQHRACFPKHLIPWLRPELVLGRSKNAAAQQAQRAQQALPEQVPMEVAAAGGPSVTDSKDGTLGASKLASCTGLQPSPGEHLQNPGSPRDSPAGDPLSPHSSASALNPFASRESRAACAAAHIYSMVKPQGGEPELAAPLPELLPTLRRYQRRAVHWMVQRELGGGQGGSPWGQAADAPIPPSPLHPLWREVPPPPGFPGGRLFYMNPYTGRLSRWRYPAAPPVRGGILCDEMGLGKTVEVLACIAAHKYRGLPPQFHNARKRKRRERVECVCGVIDDDPQGGAEDYAGLWVQCDVCDAWMHGACVGHPRAPPPGDFVCQECQRAQAEDTVTQDCGATLIVCPTPILHQWCDEIAKHTRPGSLKVVVYEGQPQPGARGSRQKLVTAASLAAADIVLTTYNVLRKDVYHRPEEESEPGKLLRHRKKYQVIPTPLTRLRWWRVCLDEAQMVESSTAKAAEMALKLHTVHRWCVTGTPISRDLSDIYGLLVFLQCAPWDDWRWWRDALAHPCTYQSGPEFETAQSQLFKLLRPSCGGIMWRNSKADVADELALPPQQHHLVNLQLSAIERHFYSRQHQDCVGKARAALPPGMLAAMSVAGFGEGASACPIADRPLTPREERKLLDPLLRLRQACCHPQVGGSGIKSLVHQKAPMTMTEILEVLITKARTEAEEAQRILLAALNGLGGLLVLQGLTTEAVAAYREALAQVERNKALIRADKLQQLHTLHNLAQLLGAQGSRPSQQGCKEDASQGVITGSAKGTPAIDGTKQRERQDSTAVDAVAMLRTVTMRGEALLVQQAQQIREEYIAEAVAKLAAAEHDMHEVTSHMDRVNAEVPGGSASADLVHSWWVDAVLLMAQHSTDQGRHIADHIKELLKESTMYLRTVSQNAASLGGRFRDLHGLELLLRQETGELQRAQHAALQGLHELTQAVAHPSADFVEQAAHCGRCRAELGVAGRVCRHCRLEEVFLRWEGRLFSLYAKAGTGAGGRVTAEEALQKAQQAALDRAERGGLGEAGALPQDHPEDASLLLGARRRDGAVATTEIVRRPGETETALRLLLHQLKIMKLPAELAARKDLLVAAGRAHLELLESARKLYLKARAVTLAQRGKLYAYDELEMATMRIRLRAPGEVVTEIEELYKIYMEEIPIRSTELSGDKAAAEAELRRTLGTLRYLHGLRADRQRAGGVGSPPRLVQQGTQRLSHHGGQQAQHGEHGRQQGRQPAGIDPAQRLPRTAAGVAAEARAAASAAAADGCEDEGPVLSCALHHPALPSDARDAALGCQPGAAAVDGGTAEHVLDTQGGATEGERDMCPVCHDTLGEELSMLPCGHRLCCRCSVVLVERLPSGQPQASKRIHCPTCRVSVPVSDIAYVDAGGDVQQGKTCMEGDAAEEASIVVRGSYGTKLENVIRKVLWITSQDAAAKLLVFSTWRDVLELVAHALRTNNVPHLYPRDAKKFDASITEFKHSNDTNADKRNTLPAHAPRVLLLLVKQGGNGLNLTEAQHVIFVDPLLDPGLEAQAVGRVHRIGQAKETHIHRFVVRSTIEENVHRLCQQRAAAMDLSAAAILSRNLQKGLTVRDVALLLEDSFGAGVQEEGLSSPQRGRSLA